MVIPFVPMVMPMVPLALPMVQLVPMVANGTIGKPMVPLATNGTIGKITNGTIRRTLNGARDWEPLQKRRQFDRLTTLYKIQRGLVETDTCDITYARMTIALEVSNGSINLLLQ